jgi:hypothetical protein
MNAFLPAEPPGMRSRTAFAVGPGAATRAPRGVAVGASRSVVRCNSLDANSRGGAGAGGISSITACRPSSPNTAASLLADAASIPRLTMQRPLSIAAPCASDSLNLVLSRTSSSSSLQGARRAPVSATCSRRTSDRII